MALKSGTEENFGTLFNNFDGVDQSVGCCQRLIKVCHLTRAPTSRLGAIIMGRRDNERLENFLSYEVDFHLRVYSNSKQD